MRNVLPLYDYDNGLCKRTLLASQASFGCGDYFDPVFGQ